MFPGIAVAEVFREINPSGEVLFIGSERGLEREILERAGCPHKPLSVGRIKGEGFGQRIKTLFRLPQSFWQARSILEKFRPDVVLGIGGYSSGPVILSASLMRLPRAILEPNAIPGFTNRILSRFVNRIFIAFGEAARFFPKARTRMTGTPVRKQLSEIGDRPTSQTVDPSKPFTILVFGGSQGATALNRAVTDLLPEIERSGRSIRIIHQTGTNDIEWVRQAYQKTKIPAEVVPFIDRMDEVYAVADLVISRAGASSVAELVATCSPSILVPYPYAADDHQRFNAKEIADGGGAEVVLNQDLGKRLGEKIFFYESHREALNRMRDALRKMRGVPAAEAVTRECLALMIRP